MDPVLLATLTSAISVLGTEVGKGVATSLGSDIWARVKSLMNWDEDPPPSELASRAAEQLQSDHVLAQKVLDALKSGANADLAASAFVHNITAEKVVSAKNLNVNGNFNM